LGLGAKQSTTWVSLMALTERAYTDVAIPPKWNSILAIKCFRATGNEGVILLYRIIESSNEEMTIYA